MSGVLPALVAAAWLFGPTWLLIGVFALCQWLDRRRRRQADERRLALLRDSWAAHWQELPNWLEHESMRWQSWELDQMLLLPCDVDTIPEAER